MTFDNLYRAMQHCKNNVMWKDSVAGYVKNGLVNVHKLKEKAWRNEKHIS